MDIINILSIPLLATVMGIALSLAARFFCCRAGSRR